MQLERRVKKQITFILIIFSSLVLSAKLIMVPGEINNPKTLIISGVNAVISEDETIYIYSLKSRSLVVSFGKEGEGPGEFKMGHGAGSLKIDIIKNELYINSSTKLSRFSMQGKLISEVKIPPLSYLIPVRERYISNCSTSSQRSFPLLSICLYDKNFKKRKAIFKSGVPIGMGARIMVPSYNFKYIVKDEKIYISTGTEKGEISVFDSNGEKIKIIEIREKALKVPGRFKDRVKKFYRTDPVYKNYWNYMKDHIYFPETFPTVKNFFIDSNKIFVQTYHEKDSRFKWIITNLEGKTIRSVWLPKAQLSEIAYSPYTIAKERFYYFKENADTETWELYMIDLNKK